eukprot:Nk52_evm2s128 gene=Nk52_evmTU2s128
MGCGRWVIIGLLLAVLVTVTASPSTTETTKFKHVSFRFEDAFTNTVHTDSRRSVELVSINDAQGDNYELVLTQLNSEDQKLLIGELECFNSDKNTKTKMSMGGLEGLKFYSVLVDGEDIDSAGFMAVGKSFAVGHFRKASDLYMVEPIMDNSNGFSKASKGDNMVVYKTGDALKGMATLPGSNEKKCLLASPSADGMGNPNGKAADSIVTEEQLNIMNSKLEASLKSFESTVGEGVTEKAVAPAKVVGLRLVLDHTYFQDRAGSNVEMAVAQAVNIVKITNTIYTSTNYGSSQFSSVEFALQKLDIYENTGCGNPFSTVTDIYDYLDILSTYTSHTSYGLVHAISAKGFNNILGLAYVGSSNAGACGRTILGYAYNTGVTNSVFQNTASADPYIYTTLTFAHEIGHNMGSGHDTQTSGDVCNPTSANGGHFIMYPFITGNSQSNNMKFSSCSISAFKTKVESYGSCMIDASSFSGTAWYNVSSGGSANAITTLLCAATKTPTTTTTKATTTTSTTLTTTTSITTTTPIQTTTTIVPVPTTAPPTTFVTPQTTQEEKQNEAVLVIPKMTKQDFQANHLQNFKQQVADALNAEQVSARQNFISQKRNMHITKSTLEDNLPPTGRVSFTADSIKVTTLSESSSGLQVGFVVIGNTQTVVPVETVTTVVSKQITTVTAGITSEAVVVTTGSSLNTEAANNGSKLGTFASTYIALPVVLVASFLL